MPISRSHAPRGNALAATLRVAEALLLLSTPLPAAAGSPDAELLLPRAQYEEGRGLKDAFEPLLAAARQSTVRVLCDGKEVALGIVMQPDGHVLTKHSALFGKTECRLADGRTFAARDELRVAIPYDLAMLRIDAANLPVADWSDRGRLDYGRLVGCPGMTDQDLEVGVIAVKEREVRPRSAVIEFAFGPPEGFGERFTRGVKVGQVRPHSGAEAAGLREGDLIVEIDGIEVEVPADFAYRYWSYWGGEQAVLSVVREGQTRWVSLPIERTPFGPDRKRGFAAAIQHDAAIRPQNAGGPLLDLSGKIVAINIARASRTETFAIPGSIVRVLLPSMVER